MPSAIMEDLLERTPFTSVVDLYIWYNEYGDDVYVGQPDLYLTNWAFDLGKDVQLEAELPGTLRRISQEQLQTQALLNRFAVPSAAPHRSIHSIPRLFK